jgi:hypothetical protein
MHGEDLDSIGADLDQRRLKPSLTLVGSPQPGQEGTEPRSVARGRESGRDISEGVEVGSGLGWAHPWLGGDLDIEQQGVLDVKHEIGQRQPAATSQVTKQAGELLQSLAPGRG